MSRLEPRSSRACTFARVATPCAPLHSLAVVLALGLLPACAQDPSLPDAPAARARAALGAEPSLTEELATLQQVAAEEWGRRRGRATHAEAAAEDRLFEDTLGWAGSFQVSWTRRGTVSSLWAPHLAIPVDAPSEASPSERAVAFIHANGALFGTLEDEPLRVEGVDTLSGGVVQVRLSQWHADLPVVGATASVRFDETGALSALSASLVPSRLFPGATPSRSRARALEEFGEDAYSAELMYRDPAAFEQPGDPALVWRVRRGRVSPGEFDVDVDATSGRTLAESPLSTGNDHREVFRFCTNAELGSGRCLWNAIPGRIVSDTQCHVDPPTPPFNQVACVSSGEVTLGCSPTGCAPTGAWPGRTQAADLATTATYNYFLARASIVGFPESMRVTTDLQPLDEPPFPVDPSEVCKSWWNDPRAHEFPHQVTMGQYRTCLDVVGHEFVHGYDELSGGGITLTDDCTRSKAVGEGIADVIGSLIETYNGTPTDWVMGTGCVDASGASCPNSSWARNSNLANPGAAVTMCNGSGCGAHDAPSVPIDYPNPNLPQPDRLAGYRRECGGYWNATIVGKIGYLTGRPAAQGAVSHGGLFVTGIGEAAASVLWTGILQNRLSGATDFGLLRNAGYTECASTPDPTNCYRAFDAVGLWSGDQLTVTPDFPSGFGADSPPDIVADPTFPLTRRTMLYWHRSPIYIGEVFARERSCGLQGACSWGSQIQVEPNVPQQQVTSAAIPSGAYAGTYVCYRSPGTLPNVGLWCRHRATGAAPWIIGPDPGGSSVIGDASLVYFNGNLYIAYRKWGGGMWWRKLVGSAWSAETQVFNGLSNFSSDTSPVLASSNEDSATPTNGSLFIAFTGSGSQAGNITYLRFNTTANDWSASLGGSGQIEHHAGPFTYQMRTQYRLAAAVHRGELDVVALNAGYNAYGAGSDNTLWYASCALPCSTAAWTPFGTIETGATSGWGSPSGSLATVGHLDSGGDGISGSTTAAMYLWHRALTGTALWRRLKVGR